MCRIGDKVFLHGECVVQPPQQVVEAVDQGLDLVWQRTRPDRRQAFGIALLQLGGDLVEWLQPVADAVPQEQCEQRQQ